MKNPDRNGTMRINFYPSMTGLHENGRRTIIDDALKKND
jgi:pantothenate synthetase